MTVRSNRQGIDIGLDPYLNCRREVIRFMVELLLLQVGTCLRGLAVQIALPGYPDQLRAEPPAVPPLSWHSSGRGGTTRRRHLAAVAAWRDHLLARGLTNSSVRRTMTAIRALQSYLHSYGYTGANPAHSDFVETPAAPRDGKAVALSPEDCDEGEGLGGMRGVAFGSRRGDDPPQSRHPRLAGVTLTCWGLIGVSSSCFDS